MTASQGSVITNPFLPGKKVGTMDINAFDAKLQGFLAALTQITPNSLPIFINYDVYLTSGGCCIGGYHSANAVPAFRSDIRLHHLVDQGSGVFSQDTAAAAHEIGEWMDDPFINNSRALPRTTASWKTAIRWFSMTTPIPSVAFTYHLQDLVFIDYFGGPKTLPVNNWLSFQNDEKSTCPGLP